MDVLERVKNEAGRIVEWHGLRIDLQKDLDVQMVGPSSLEFSAPLKKSYPAGRVSDLLSALYR
jgi:hypothetical protein